MNLLQFIWWTSLVLALSSLMVMVVLVLRRMRDERRARQEQHVRGVIQKILFNYMDSDWMSGQKDLNNLMNMNRAAQHVLRKLTIDLCHLIQGQERQQLTSLLTRSGFRDECVRDLRSRSVEDRRSAASALQLFSDTTTEQALLAALNDDDGHVRLAAASSLKMINALPDLRLLISKLEEKDVLASRDVRTLFRDMARRKPLALRQLAADSSNDTQLKIVLADAMSETSDFRVLDDLYRFASDDDLDVRTTALRSLGALQHPDAAAVVEHSLSDAQWQVRAVAAGAAGQIGLEYLVPQLTRLLDDDSWWVRFRSAEALSDLGATGQQALRERAATINSVNDNAGGRMAALVLDEHGLHELVPLADADQTESVSQVPSHA
ncbi:MAG: HEAT repeat domain-containing protein [Gammaproteobacteria bacterium]|nr:HEAT repeat domain-containing protein [Gammaproteobacteria bacterium]